MNSPAPQIETALTKQRVSRLAGILNGLPDWVERIFGNQGQRHVLWLTLLVLLFSVPLIVTPLPLRQQAILAVILIGIGWFLVRLEQREAGRKSSESLHLLLMWLSIIVTLRYLYYRTFNTLNLDGWLNAVFSLLLYAAELYAIATLLLAYFQTLKVKDRKPVDISYIPQERWFNVDIYIPTYNEDIEIVRKTAVAAMGVDYPADKKQVYILDDGRKFPERREKLRQMCLEIGCTLMTRDNNDHAKAGNINHAMRRTKGDLILILDCDHIPSRHILLNTVGFFLNPKVSLVQTPHWFYNPDPFERNLLTQGQVPVGNELFYKILQRGNDFWNAAFFCGSAAVVRKSHVLEIGGIAVETVTEDCHTSLRLHMLGYETVYYDKIMVAGLAPEKFSSYVGQQVRWARGMAQILRLEWPLFNRKLTIPQRICYTSATTHFFFGFPRLMYAIAPIAFLVFGINSVRGLGLETLTYALPSIVLALNANYIVHKGVRFSFWNEVFEYAMAFQDGLVTFMALVNPKLGSFNVTDKGLQVTRRTFDWSSVQVLLVAGILSILSMVMVPYWLITGLQTWDAVVINAVWCVVNIMLLSAAILVALEQPQLRQSHRLERKLTALIYAGTETLTGKTLDISETGARVVLNSWPNLPDAVDIELHGDYGSRAFVSGRVMRVTPRSENEVILAISFEEMTPVQRDALVIVLYSDVKEWYSQVRSNADKPLESIKFLATSIWRAFREPQPLAPVEVRKRIQTQAQVYIEGQYLPSTALEINSRTIQLAISPDHSLSLHPEVFAQGQAVGLVLLPTTEHLEPIRLVAQVERLERSEEVPLLELSFPKVLDSRQGQRIRTLLYSAYE
ncbi:MAG TPA: UDP-forming cellulose synthase catalytic subunit [Leptolyngbyaceae cyanobacterium]